MRDSERPMPLSELPGYVEHARKHGQGDYVPVVEMGTIVDERPSLNWRLPLAFASAFCLFVAVYSFNSAGEIRIVSDLGASEVTSIVSDEGARVFSVRKEADGTYRLRVFSAGGFRSLVERLKKNDDLEKVE